MQNLKPGARRELRAKLRTQISNNNWKIGAMIMATAATRAINVMGPRLSANTESHRVALFFRPFRLMLMTG
ncbi:hypothetical protein D3C79_1039910 [compost metagenome]